MPDAQTSNANLVVDGDVCRLAGPVDFETAPALLDAVASHIAADRHLVIDFAQVSKANSAALALMLEWKNLANDRGGQVNHQNLPDSIRQLSQICQVSSII